MPYKLLVYPLHNNDGADDAMILCHGIYIIWQTCTKNTIRPVFRQRRINAICYYVALFFSRIHQNKKFKWMTVKIWLKKWLL